MPENPFEKKKQKSEEQKEDGRMMEKRVAEGVADGLTVGVFKIAMIVTAAVVVVLIFAAGANLVMREVNPWIIAQQDKAEMQEIMLQHQQRLQSEREFTEHVKMFQPELTRVKFHDRKPRCIPEALNGKDDDCDGHVDEGLQCEGERETRDCGINFGACTKGVQTCLDGHWTLCNGVMPSEEVHDDVDNDCDGLFNEGKWCIHGNVIPCDGGKGTSFCYDGIWSPCTGAGYYIES